MDDTTRQTAGMREILRLAEKLSVADVLAPVSAELAKIELIDRHVAEAVKVGRDAHTRATAALVAGTAPDPADLAAVLTLAPSPQPTGPYPPALAAIKTRARSAVHQTAWTLGLSLTGELYARMGELAKGAVAIAGKAKLPADAADENLLFRDPAHAAAYAKVVQAWGIFVDVHRMGDLLRKTQWLDALDGVPGGYIMFKHPHKRLTHWQIVPGGEGVVLFTGEQTDTVMATTARRDFAPALFFWHAIRVGAQPGLYDLADAGKRYLAYLSEQEAPKSEIDRLRQTVDAVAARAGKR